MTASNRTFNVQRDLSRRGILASFEQCETLRRAEITLHRWAEQECGDENNYASWAIERDEATGKPFRCTYPHTGKSHRHSIPDREAGALKRVATVCKELGAAYFHQTDPRGVALYLGTVPLSDSSYNRDGVAISGDSR